MLYVYIYVYIDIRIYIYMCVCIHVCVYIYIYVPYLHDLCMWFAKCVPCNLQMFKDEGTCASLQVNKQLSGSKLQDLICTGN